MADPWVFLLAGASLVLLGFAAAQIFDRFRVPDYFILMALGLLLGSGLLPLGGCPEAGWRRARVSRSRSRG